MAQREGHRAHWRHLRTVGLPPTNCTAACRLTLQGTLLLLLPLLLRKEGGCIEAGEAQPVAAANGAARRRRAAAAASALCHWPLRRLRPPCEIAA